MLDLTNTAALLKQSRYPVVFTGAGISAESGIPTFRGTQGGLWSKYEPAQLASAEAYRKDKALVWGWYVWRMALVRRAQPNVAHAALVKLQEYWPDMVVISQNVDDLHERAGSKNILHLHGELFAHRCFACARPFNEFTIPDAAADNPELRLTPPRCPHCNGYVRPGVTWFGEQLPSEAWKLSSQACDRSDLMMVIGTSGVVQPAASLVQRAKHAGAKIVEINPEPSSHTRLVDIHLKSSAAAALHQLVEELGNA